MNAKQIKIWAKLIWINTKTFGWRYFLFNPGYQFLRFIHHLTEKTKKTGNINKEKAASVRRINGYKMFLDPKKKGIHRELFRYLTREPIATKIIGEKVDKKDTILDIGANIGYYVVLESILAGKNGLVYAVEPDEDNFNFLSKNIKINNLKNVQKFNYAFGKEDKILDLNIYEEGNLNSPIMWKKPLKVLKVKCITVDHFLKNRKKPDLMRMDVEGYEPEILLGAKKSLKDIDKLFLELHFSMVPKVKMIKLLNLLKENGFEVSEAIIEFKPDAHEENLFGKIIWFFYNQRRKYKRYKNLTIDKILKSKEILDGYLGAFEIFFEKIK
jgi:FkbM family methyltransferase